MAPSHSCYITDSTGQYKWKLLAIQSWYIPYFRAGQSRRFRFHFFVICGQQNSPIKGTEGESNLQHPVRDPLFAESKIHMALMPSAKGKDSFEISSCPLNMRNHAIFSSYVLIPCTLWESRSCTLVALALICGVPWLFGCYCSYILSQQDGGTFQILGHPTRVQERNCHGVREFRFIYWILHPSSLLSRWFRHQVVGIRIRLRPFCFVVSHS